MVEYANLYYFSFLRSYKKHIHDNRAAFIDGSHDTAMWTKYSLEGGWYGIEGEDGSVHP